MELFLIFFSLFFDLIFFLFAAILLFKQSPFQIINRPLAMTFMLMSVCGFWLTYLNYAVSSNPNLLLPYYYPFSLVIVMFIGPSIYRYVQLLLRQQSQPQSDYRWWLHAIPAIPAVAFLVYFATLPSHERVIWLLADYEHVRWQEYIINLLFYTQLTVYILLCISLVNKQLKLSEYVVIDGKRTNIRWLRNFFRIALILFAIKTAVCSFLNSDHVNTMIGLMFMDVLFLYFFIRSVWETGLMAHAYTDLPRETETTIKIQPQTVDIYKCKLLRFMDDEKIYLDANCSIEDVAERCDIPKHHLSHLLNVQMGKGFVDFVNEYRIQYATQLLLDSGKKHLTLEALGLECGFGSKATFNRAFKKHTGLTPSAYKQINGV